MRNRMRLLVGVVAVLLATVGCAQRRGDLSQDPNGPPLGGIDQASFDQRAAQVGSAWDAAALASWKNGFVPLEDLSGLDMGPNDTPYLAGSTDLFQRNAKMAVAVGAYVLGVPSLPSGPANGTIGFPGGASMRVPLMSATDAFAAIHTGEPSPNCTDSGCHLTVTGAVLVTTKVRTSRGTATVPAWSFSIRELAVAVLRVAVAPAAVTVLPTSTLAPDDRVTSVDAVGGLTSSVKAAAAKALELRFIGGQCDASRTGLVYETATAVVVGASVRRKPMVCAMVGVGATANVELKAPVGDRILLDAATGRPIVVLNFCQPASGLECAG